MPEEYGRFPEIQTEVSVSGDDSMAEWRLSLIHI